MGVLLIAAAAGGTAAALFGGWKKALKPRVQKKLAALVVAEAPAALGGSKCELESVDFHISSETSVTLKNFTIHNLDPYKSEYLASIGCVTVIVDAKSAAKSAVKAAGKPKEVRIVSVEVNGFHIILEKDGVTTSNLKTLLNKLESEEHDTRRSRAGTVHHSEAPPVAQSSGTVTKPPPDLRIGKVFISLLKVEATTPLHEHRGLPKVKMTLPDIQFLNFSQKVHETNPKTLIRKLVSTLLVSITDATKELGLTALSAVTNVTELTTETAVQVGSSAVMGIGSAAGSMFEAAAAGAWSLLGSPSGGSSTPTSPK